MSMESGAATRKRTERELHNLNRAYRTLKRAPENSPERLRLGKIVEASDRAAEIVRQILTFSREDDEEKTVVDMGTMVDETAAPSLA